MLAEWELTEEARIQRIALRSHATYLGYAANHQGAGAAYWLTQARDARLRYAESVAYVATYGGK